MHAFVASLTARRAREHEKMPALGEHAYPYLKFVT
jgi:hypothetical protein